MRTTGSLESIRDDEWRTQLGCRHWPCKVLWHSRPWQADDYLRAYNQGWGCHIGSKEVPRQWSDDRRRVWRYHSGHAAGRKYFAAISERHAERSGQRTGSKRAGFRPLRRRPDYHGRKQTGGRPGNEEHHPIYRRKAGPESKWGEK